MHYQFQLEKYRGLKTRHHCPACGGKKSLVRYVNEVDGNYIADHVGRCNREVNCGYHYKPGQYFRDNDINSPLPIVSKKPQPIVSKIASLIPEKLLKKSLHNYDKNNLILFLKNNFGEEAVRQAINQYQIGTSKHWTGATAFWQIDIKGKVRTGKVMLYDFNSGKRIKKPHNHISWVHSILKLDNFNLKQCLFGEHLLALSDKPVCVVESEKTAVLASLYLPDYIWLATGGLQNLNPKLFTSLKHRQIILYPDLGAYELWEKKMESLLKDKLDVSISSLLEERASKEEKNKGYDIADYLIDFIDRNQESIKVSDEALIDFTKDEIKPCFSYSDQEIRGKLEEHFPESNTKVLFRKLVEKKSILPCLPLEHQFYLSGSTPF